VIGQVASDGKVGRDVDPERAQPFGRTNPGAVQDRRAVVRAVGIDAGDILS